MGACMVGYMVRGPLQIEDTEEKIGRVAETLSGIRSFIAAGQKAEEEEREGDYLAMHETSIGKALNDYGWLDCGFIDACDLPPILDPALPTTEAEIRTKARELVEFWRAPDGGAAWRDFEGFRVVFAGDESWGDEPDSEAYQALKLLVLAPIAEILGLD